MKSQIIYKTLGECKPNGLNKIAKSAKVTNAWDRRTFILIIITLIRNGGWFMVFNATFNNISVISWRSVLLVEETGVHGENQYIYLINHVSAETLTTWRMVFGRQEFWRIRLIGSFIRWYGRSGDVPYQHIKVPIYSVNNICFHIHKPMYGFHWSIPHLHIRYYCALRHRTWLRNVGYRV